ncbi:hypothetical protein U1Q18_010134, partial [Sarracenia purpurea var. burkii]
MFSQSELDHLSNGYANQLSPSSICTKRRSPRLLRAPLSLSIVSGSYGGGGDEFEARFVINPELILSLDLSLT